MSKEVAGKGVDAVGADLLKLRKESREKAVWAKNDEVLLVVIDEFVPDPTDRVNDFGKAYTTNDWLIPVKLDDGSVGTRKVHITQVDAIISKAEAEGKLRKGEVVEFVMPPRNDNVRGGRRGGRRY